MYCINCGEDNLAAAKFCRKCGDEMGGPPLAAVGVERPDDVEDETRIAVRRGGGEMRRRASTGIADHDSDGKLEDEAEIFSISPTLMFVKAGYVLAAIGALLLVAIASAFTGMSAWIAVLIGMLLFLIPLYYHFRQKMMRYTLTESQLEIDEGFISRSTRNVPIRRIQDVTVSAGVTQRLLGFGDLMIDNASDEGGKVVLKNINSPKKYADILLRQMRRLDR